MDGFVYENKIVVKNIDEIKNFLHAPLKCTIYGKVVVMKNYVKSS